MRQIYFSFVTIPFEQEELAIHAGSTIRTQPSRNRALPPAILNAVFFMPFRGFSTPKSNEFAFSVARNHLRCMIRGRCRNLACAGTFTENEPYRLAF
jgi:hypothetical protein